MSIIIKTVQSRSDIFNFINLPRLIFSQDERYPSQLAQAANPLTSRTLKRVHARLFLALENDRPVGRIAAVIDPYSREPETGFFGAFESIDRLSAARQLFSYAERWLAERKIKKIIGPATFNTNEQVGFLIEGFNEPPSPFLPYNPPYYQGLAEDCGYEKFTDLLSYYYPITKGIPSIIERIAGRAAQKEELIIHSLDKFGLVREAEMAKIALNCSMAENWGYIPFSFQEMRSLLNYCFQQSEPSLALVITAKNDPAAFSLCFPATGVNPYPRLGLLGVVEKYRGAGLESLLIKKTVNYLLAYGYETLEISQIDEKNLSMTKIINRFVAGPCKRHRVYQKTIA
jgi:GNAT superfamily N-acetyltransferase